MAFNLIYFQKPTDAQSPQELAPYDNGASLPTIDTEQSPQVFWPCAPDGFIPNSVIRQRVKPRKPPSRLIPRLTRAKQKRVRAFVEDEKEVEENRDRIRGISNFYHRFCENLLNWLAPLHDTKREGQAVTPPTRTLLRHPPPPPPSSSPPNSLSQCR